MKIKLLTYIILMINILYVNNGVAENNITFNPTDTHHVMMAPSGKGPFPAVLLLHASGGIEKSDYDWATTLKNQGYVVYIIDSFTPRHYKDRKTIGWDKATSAQISDVLPAYRYLITLPYVDPKRIGLLGFSMGGYDALRMTGINTPFKTAASFYGVCKRLPSNTKFNIPTKIFIGKNDDRATLADCEQLIKTNQSINNKAFIAIYPKALHGFDNSEFPASKELVDERNDKYHVGYNKEAHNKATGELIKFFNHYLK